MKLIFMWKLKKVETKDGDTVVIVYFDDIDTKEIRPQIKAYRTHKVAKQKPSPVVIYDYYDNCKYFIYMNKISYIEFPQLARRATTFYSPPEISIHDITDYWSNKSTRCWKRMLPHVTIERLLWYEKWMLKLGFMNFLF